MEMRRGDKEHRTVTLSNPHTHRPWMPRLLSPGVLPRQENDCL